MPQADPAAEVRRAIAPLIEASTARMRLAWERLDARLAIPEGMSGAVRQTPAGELSEADAMRADIQRRMDMTVRVDTMIEQLDSLHLLSPDSAVAFSGQRFVRVIRLPDGTERQRFTTVTQQRLYVRSGGQWALAGPLREVNPRSWWAGEAPPNP